MLGDPAIALDAETRTVTSAAGRTLAADAIVLATGIRLRSLPGSDGLRGVHVRRSLEDAVALRDDLLTATSGVIVGDGLLGAEIAATARARGTAVTLVSPQLAPMARQLGPRVAGPAPVVTGPDDARARPRHPLPTGGLRHRPNLKL